MEEKVIYQITDAGYGIIRINRPEKRNAISVEMAYQFQTLLKKAEQDNVKFLVITATGDKMFCSGGDLQDLHGNLTPTEAEERLSPMKNVLWEIVSFPVPVICLLNGNALGGGCELATACDIRIAKENSTFGFVQSSLGILPGWGGGALLYEKIHPSLAMQWLAEATVFDANTLNRIGWLHRVVHEDLYNNITELLKPYIEKSSAQMKLLKKQFYQQLTRQPLLKLMEEEVKNSASLWESSTHKKAVSDFLSQH